MKKQLLLALCLIFTVSVFAAKPSVVNKKSKEVVKKEVKATKKATVTNKQFCLSETLETGCSNGRLSVQSCCDGCSIWDLFDANDSQVWSFCFFLPYTW